MYVDLKKNIAKTGSEAPDNPVLPRLHVEMIFGLTDQYRENVGRDDFRGPFTLMNFGCEGCPELCPKPMMRIASLMKIPADPAKFAKPVFDTFDPARNSKTCWANIYFISTNARLSGWARTASTYGCGMQLVFLSFLTEIAWRNIFHCALGREISSFSGRQASPELQSRRRTAEIFSHPGI